MALHSCFQPASPSTPHTTPLQNLAFVSRIGSRRVTDWPGDSVAELSGGTGRQWRGAVGRYWDSVAELFGTEAVRGNLTTELHLHCCWFTTTATGSSPSPGAHSLDSQALQHEGTLHVGVGAAVPSTVPEEWDPLSWAGWPTSCYPSTAGSSQLTSAWPKRGQGLHQHLREMHCGAML